MCCHGNTFVKERLGKNFSFSSKWHFSHSKRIWSDFLARIGNQRLRIDPCVKFQLNWTKDKGTRILSWKDTKNDLMTSDVPPGNDQNQQNFYGFWEIVSEYHYAKFGCNWTTNKGETGGTICPQPIWFQKTPAWIG